MLKIKNLRIILLSIIFTFFIMISSSYAVNLDLSDDLLGNMYPDTNSNASMNDTNTRNNTYTSNNSNTSTLNNTSISNSSSPSATITNSLPESDLGLSNILNIFLIVIGILLILLSIAILIRLKK